MAVVFLMAPMLSVWAFGGKDYTIAFRVVSVIMLFNQINIGQTVLLQGTFHYKYMAKSALLGNVLGLVITLPLYYIFGIKAIVPAIIISSIIALSLSWYYASKISFHKVKLSIKEWWIKGKGMISLGIVIALTGLAGVGQAYILRIFIANMGGVNEVGLYVAAFAISNTYVSLILSSMASDYAPRLSAVANDKQLLITTINKQANLLLVILTPLILVFIVFVKLLILLLYSSQFVAILSMTEWVMLGMFFRAFSWTISFAFIARGESKTFFINELISSIYTLGFYMLGYKIYGFEGMGIAFVLSYICYCFQMFLLAKIKFQFYIEKNVLKTIIIQILFCIGLFIVLNVVGYGFYRYIIGFIFITASIFFTYRQLSRMMDLKTIIQQFKNKLIKK
ncbi:MAG TPA: oligosaccharide flippase family protein [Bacteroidales bacterium]|nr:oligosaccharide flippase family protein [Bacteroidales bacterium]